DMNLGYTYTGANNPGLDQGAYCPVDDQSRGVDMQLIFTPVDNWQIILSYAHTIRKITQGPAFVKYTKGYDPFSLWFIRAESPVDYQGSGPLSNYSDPHDTSTYNRSYAKGLRLDDTPADQGAIWSNYKFKDGTLKGFALGAGATYQGPRDVSGDALGTKPTVGNTALYRDSRAKTLYNAMLAYTFRVDRREWRAQLNAANLLDNQKKYGLNYQTPRSMKVSLNVGF
ncbi:MAG: TonB-dependent receptor plug, partial [Verrucomicrobia bacterium]|nr:TonB-dependent receptor plug [Verrucomicrobiota bacterium]